MPLICEPDSILRTTYVSPFERRKSQQHQQQPLDVLKTALMASAETNGPVSPPSQSQPQAPSRSFSQDGRSLEELKGTLDRTLQKGQHASPQPSQGEFKRPPVPRHGSITQAMNDTPATTAPSSPRLLPIRQNSGTSTPRVRPTTLDIPGLTKSKVSPDGRIASRDVGAKLVIVMVGLPARGKSYITKKLARYLNWLQHDCTIFNVGERRRVAAGGPNTLEKTKSRRSVAMPARSDSITGTAVAPPGLVDQTQFLGPSAATIMLNGERPISPPGTPRRPSKMTVDDTDDADEHTQDNPNDNAVEEMPDSQAMDQSANFFDPENKKAALIREQCAMDTLDELLDYILDGNGSVGILDATNSTLERRKIIMKKIRERAGPDLNVLFLESRCVDANLLESNMRLKLSGPDYKDKDPIGALEDFKNRVAIYEKNYIPLGEYEEANDMPYIQMIDVGRKVISHQIKGFLMAQANYYLLNFNLAPRQIWITRHGLSVDNVSGKIGGDSELSPEGERYARSLTSFIDNQRKEWDLRQLHKLKHSHFPPQPGDTTPPNPHYQPNANNELPQKAFCVWTSMLKRSIQTAQFFDEEEYDTKQMRMLDELNAGLMEGLTYASIASDHPAEYEMRKKDKLHYRYPGPGGEGYLDIINRLRPVIVELERMTDHVLLVGHRSVARVLLAYFRGLKREEVADLDVPIGMLYCLEPKPYGVDFKAFQWDKNSEWFHEKPDYKLTKAVDDMQ
ncbi:hypothetical protein MBLNU457_7153t1 [Dothideomycetes sp. NU457]